MKSSGKKAPSRAAMSEPHLRKRRATPGLDDSISELRQVQSRTVQKRKSMSGRELVRWKRQQLKQRAEETITKRLFVDSAEMADLADGTGSPLFPQRVADRPKHDRPKHKSSPCCAQAICKGKRSKGTAVATAKVGATSTPLTSHDINTDSAGSMTKSGKRKKKTKNSSPKEGATSTPLTSHDINTESSMTKSQKRKKKTQNSSQKAFNTTKDGLVSSGNSDGHVLDSSLDSTLPMDDSTTPKTVCGDDVVSFPNTPLTGMKLGKNRTMSNLDTPAVTEKTPMPVGDEEWKDETPTAAGRQKAGDWKKSLSRVKREKKKKQFLVKCTNIPKGVTPELFGMFLGECDLYPEIRIKRMKRGGVGKKRPPRYAILVCKTKEDYDALLNLDGIAIPQLTPKGKEMPLKFMPQMTHSEARSSHALRVTNLADSITEDELREFFKKNRLTCGKIQLYPADRAAYVVFRSAGDMRRARRIKERKLKGCPIELKTNKGYINHDVEHNLMED